MSYKVKIDGEEIEVSQKDLDAITQHDQKLSFFSLENRVFKVSNTGGTKAGKIVVNHDRFDYQILDPYDQVVEKLGMNNVAEVKSTNIYSPMPGLILDIAVSVGDVVEEGQTILILEAMKMENVIKANGGGTVKSILFNLKDKVEKGQLIVEIE